MAQTRKRGCAVFLFFAKLSVLLSEMAHYGGADGVQIPDSEGKIPLWGYTY